MNELHLFAGAGGGILGGMLLGHTTVCAVEIEPYARRVLLQRQREGILPRFPIWDDVRTFDGKPWRGRVDVLCGGFPCKGISTTGPGTGLDHAESALWQEQARIIRDVEPSLVFVENSPALTMRGMGGVLGDLAAMGYDAEWGVLGAGEIGAPHERERMWILAAHPDRTQREGGQLSFREREKYAYTGGSPWWKDKPGIYGVDDGMANRVDRLIAIGNGQVPAVAALAFQVLSARLDSALPNARSEGADK